MKRQRGNVLLFVMVVLVSIVVLNEMRARNLAKPELVCEPTGQYGLRLNDQGISATTAPLLTKVQKYKCTDDKDRWYPVEDQPK